MSIISMENNRYWMEIGVCSDNYSINISGIVDTGAKGTILPRTLLKSLPDLKPIRRNVSRSGTVPGAHRLYSEYVVTL